MVHKVAASGRSRRRTPPASLVRHAASLLPQVDPLLGEAYGTAPLGNLPDPLDELVFIQLSIRTPESVYVDVFSVLREEVGGDWGALLHLPDERAISILEPGGMAQVKLRRLRSQLLTIRQEFGSITLAPLAAMAVNQAEEFLLGLPGVGPKAARCVLLYSLGRPVFPVDSHCLRIMKRLGLAPPELDRKLAHDFVQDLVPNPMRHSLHVNMVHHGRILCLPRSPRCRVCPLLSLCPTGARRTE